MSRIERLRQKFFKPGNSPEPEKSPLTRQQVIILATGLEIESNGKPWWRDIEMVNLLDERKVIGKVGGRASVYVDIAKLNAEGMLETRMIFTTERPTGRIISKLIKPTETPLGPVYMNGVERRVSNQGRKERSKVDIREESKNRSTSKSPIPETN